MPDKPRIVVDPHFRRMEEIFSAEDLARLHRVVDVVWGRDDPMPLDEAEAAITTATAVVCSGWRYGIDLAQAPHLRAIIDVGGAFPRALDYAQCFSRGIRVLTAAPGFANQVAEMALGLALAASRDIALGDRAMRAGNELYLHAGNEGTFLLFGKRVGFIGFGSLARALRALLAPFGCPISVYDPWLAEGYLRHQGVEPLPLEQLLSSSQVIFVLAIPSAENRALLSRELLERIAPGAVLVLISRAHVVDFDALTDLVLAGRFKAAIDVFPTEPLAPDHPIRRAENAVLSAHRAGSVREGLWELGEMVVDDLEAIAAGLPPRRLQVAQPELVARYATIATPRRKEDEDGDSALFDPWTRDYALLGLRMDRLAPGTVDAWMGPPAWREAVNGEPRPTPDALRAAADDLLQRLPTMGYAPVRAAYLTRQVRAMQAGARLLGGESMSLAEQARLFFDIRPERVPETAFEAAHAAMDAALPGPGSLAERLAAWRQQLVVPPEHLPPLLDRIAVEVRSRTAGHIALPDGESIEIVLVRDQPWAAYNWYLGGARSRIEVNTDLPAYANNLVDYMAHEGYPGHHTEHALREMRQFRGKGQGEYAIQIINTPENLIAEAIATCACSLIFDGDDDLAWLAAELLPGLGMTMDVAQATQVRAASRALRAVQGNAAFLLHEDGRSPDEVAAYLERWGLYQPREARKQLEFLQSPLWRAYTFTYIYGRQLLAPLLAGADRFAVFERVATEPVYPSLLAAWPAGNGH